MPGIATPVPTDDVLVRLIALIAAFAPATVILVYFVVRSGHPIHERQLWQAIALGACSAFPASMIAQVAQEIVGVGGSEAAGDEPPMKFPASE